MGNVKKFLISLLVGITLTGIFLILGQLGLYNRIETTFYDQRVFKQVDDNLSRVNAVFEEYQSGLLTNIQDLIYSPTFRRSYTVNQLTDDIASRRDQITAFALDYPAFLSLRFFDENFSQIHYSSNLSDIEVRGSAGISYYPVEDITLSIDPAAELDPEQLQAVGSWQSLFLDDLQLLLYFFPVYNDLDIFEGWAMLEIDRSSIRNMLLRQQLIPYGENIYIFSPNGLLLNGPQDAAELLPLLRERWQALLQDSEELNLDIEGIGKVLVRIQDGGEIASVYLIPLSELQLTPAMKAMLALLLFFTGFLLLFLLLNLRQDSEVVIRDRIKRFQLDLLQQSLDQQGNVDINRWQSDLRLRKDLLKTKITSGIASRDKKRYSELIDSSWDDILNVLGTRQLSNRASTPVNFDAANLEQLVENLVARLEHSGTAPLALSQSTTVKKPAVITKKNAPEELPADLESLDVANEIEEAEALEEVEALDVADELANEVSSEIASEPEYLGEPLEALELEEVEALDVVDEIDSEPEDLSEPLEALELEEAEVLDVVDELANEVDSEPEDLSEPLEALELEEAEVLEEEERELEEHPLPVSEILPDLHVALPELVELDLDKDILEIAQDFVSMGGGETLEAAELEVEAVEEELPVVEAFSEPDLPGSVQELVPVTFSRGISSLSPGGYTFMDSSMALATLDAVYETPDSFLAENGEDAEELEVLDELEDISNEEIEEILPQSISVADLYESLNVQIIHDHEEVPRISNTTLRQVPKEGGDELRELVEEVVHGLTSGSSYSQFMPEGDEIDFDNLLSSSDEVSESSANRTYYEQFLKVPALHLTEKGVDYALYESGFSHKPNGALQALMKLSIDMESQVTLLVEESDGTVSLVNSIGFDLPLFDKRSEEDIRQIFSVIEKQEIEYLDSTSLQDKFPLFSLSEKRIVGILFFPCSYHEHRAVLIFGLAKPVNNLKEFCSQIFTI